LEKIGYLFYMKNVIRHILKETVMNKLIDSMFPELNNLKTKSNFSSTIYGENTIYYNKDNKEYYFRVSEPRKSYVWGLNDTVEDKYLEKTLYIYTTLYNEIISYIPDDSMILKWFNEKYNQDAEVLKRKHQLKGR
jgi:hypothetical protein